MQLADLHEDALNELSVKTRNVGAVIFHLRNRRPESGRTGTIVTVEKHEQHTHIHELAPSAAAAIAQNILQQIQQQEPPASLPAVSVSVEEDN